MSVLLLTGCSAVGDVADGLADIASEAGDAIADTIEEIDQGSEGSGAESGSGPSTGGGDTPVESGQPPADGTASALSAPIDDLAGVGHHGPAMLRSSIDRLVIEVDVQSGVSVDQAALDHLVSTIRQVADKPGGVALAGGNTFQSDRREWTTAQMRDVAAQHRSNFSGGGTVVVYVLYLDGGLFVDGQQTQAIGVAHNASEFAVLPGRWEGLSLLDSNRAIERAVLVHEWGHLLGLVNIGYTSEIDHEDPDHPGHSRSQDSVMYYAIESTLIGQVFSGPPPDSFNQSDLADIEGLRTGKYRA